jgi:hypothetical protein
MTKAERIAELAGQIEDDTKARLLKDIIGTLKEFAPRGRFYDAATDAPIAAGLLAAIEIIESNY